LFFAISVFKPASIPGDEIEHTTLTAEACGSEIGRDVLQWGEQEWGKQLAQGAIYSWPQYVSIAPEQNGLVAVSIAIKFLEADHELLVPQPAYCYVQEGGGSQEKSKLAYAMSRLRGRVITFN